MAASLRRPTSFETCVRRDGSVVYLDLSAIVSLLTRERATEAHDRVCSVRSMSFLASSRRKTDESFLHCAELLQDARLGIRIRHGSSQRQPLFQGLVCFLRPSLPSQHQALDPQGVDQRKRARLERVPARPFPG